MNMKEIAQLAGVTAATVSNAINGTGKVSEKKRKEITTCRDYILYILLLYMNCIYIHKGYTFITCVCMRAQFCLLMR